MSPLLKTLSMAIMLASLAGCVSQHYTDTKADADKVHQKIDAHSQVTPSSQVQSISRPPISTVPLVVKQHIPWLAEPVSVKANALPLSMVIAQVLKGAEYQGQNIKVWFLSLIHI